jgi:hypothetical protein
MSNWERFSDWMHRRNGKLVVAGDTQQTEPEIGFFAGLHLRLWLSWKRFVWFIRRLGGE